MVETLFYDVDTGKAVYGTWINDGKHVFTIDQDALDLIRWGSESPNVEVSPYENLRNQGDKIFYKSGKFRQRKGKKHFPIEGIKLVYDDGIKQRFRAEK